MLNALYRRSGFSLVELVVTLVIIGVATAIAVPRISNSIQRNRLNAAARRIAADLNMVQARANITSSTLTVTFTFASSSYQISGITDFDRPLASYNVNLAAEPYGVALLSTGFGGSLQTSGTSQVSFGGFGLPSSGGNITIGLGSATAVIAVDPSSGRALVQ